MGFISINGGTAVATLHSTKVCNVASPQENLFTTGKMSLWLGEDPNREAGRLERPGIALLK